MELTILNFLEQLIDQKPIELLPTALAWFISAPSNWTNFACFQPTNSKLLKFATLTIPIGKTTLISSSKFMKASNFRAQPFYFHFNYQQKFAEVIVLQAQSTASGFASAQWLV